jgi:hypothetical protein
MSSSTSSPSQWAPRRRTRRGCSTSSSSPSVTRCAVARVRLRPLRLLWADADKQWAALVARLQTALPHLFVLGTYDAAKRTGPAIWLRCVVDRVLQRRRARSRRRAGPLPARRGPAVPARGRRVPARPAAARRAAVPRSRLAPEERARLDRRGVPRLRGRAPARRGPGRQDPRGRATQPAAPRRDAARRPARPSPRSRRLRSPRRQRSHPRPPALDGHRRCPSQDRGRGTLEGVLRRVQLGLQVRPGQEVAERRGVRARGG